MARLLSDDARKQVAAAIAKAELQCPGEIVFFEAPRSHDYAQWLLLPVGLSTLAAACCLHLLWPSVPAVWLLAATAPLAGVLWWLANRRWLTLLLVPDAEEVQAVRGKALQMFTEHALFETDNRAGILIYTSAFERRVEILADRGLNNVIDEAMWREHVAHIVQSIRAGKTAEGVCEVISRVSQRLAQQWGAPHPAKNVLPDLP